jgi:hypothetical protein
MTLQEIKWAVEEGKNVYCGNKNYKVVRKQVEFDEIEFQIVCQSNGYTVGLTWKDGKTLNGQENEFFIEGGK